MSYIWFLKAYQFWFPLFTTVISLLQINSAVMSMVDIYFPPSTGVSIIAEPGSFFVSSAFTLAVNIISKEVVARDRQDQANGQWHDIHLGYIFIKVLRYYLFPDSEEYDGLHTRSNQTLRQPVRGAFCCLNNYTAYCRTMRRTAMWSIQELATLQL